MMKVLKGIVLLLLISSCGATVNYDYDSQTDFSTYKTYNYFSNIESGLSELDLKRFMTALDNTLAAKGYTLSETPDFFIDIKSNQFRSNNGSNVGVGLGGGGGNVGGGISVGIPIGSNTLDRQIILDFVDNNGTRLIWQAVSESSYNPNASPEKREADFIALVDKILSQYPPK